MLWGLGAREGEEGGKERGEGRKPCYRWRIDGARCERLSEFIIYIILGKNGRFNLPAYLYIAQTDQRKSRALSSPFS
jgi:hypothetical protein